jgi:peroxiredoxin
MQTLGVGEQFPLLQARAVDGSTLRVPDELRDGAAVLIFYRGHW